MLRGRDVRLNRASGALPGEPVPGAPQLRLPARLERRSLAPPAPWKLAELAAVTGGVALTIALAALVIAL